MAKNSYKSNTFKKKPAAKTKKRFSLNLKLAFLNDRRLHLAFGLFLLITSLFLFTAFLSYLFTGRADQDVLDAAASTGLRRSGLDVENWLGLIGAQTSHLFIFKWFGIAAFLIPPLLFAFGYHIVFKKRLVIPQRATQFVLFFLFWLSLLLGYLVLDSDEISALGFLGGGIGYELALLTSSFIGWGTFLLLAFALLVFIIFYFNVTTLLGFRSTMTETMERGKQQLQDGLEALTADEAQGKAVDGTDGADSADTADAKDAEAPEPQEDDPEEEGLLTDEEELARWEVKGKKSPKAKEAPAEAEASGPSFEIQEPTPAPAAATTPPVPPTPKVAAVATPPAPKAEPSFDLEIDTGGHDLLDEAEAPNNEHVISEKTPVVPVAKKEVDPAALPDLLVEEEKTREKIVEELGHYDPTLDLPEYQFPGLDILKAYDANKVKVTKEELEANKDKIVETLINFKIGIASIKATIGPTVTLYEIVPEAGVKISKIKNLEDDIALSLAALGIRIIAPIPGKGTIGIEVPNKNREMVSIRSVLGTEKFQQFKGALPVGLGKTITNEVFVADLAKMPHLLMAGATGQGKSVGLNVVLASLLYRKHPSQLKFVLVDPKKVELTLFNKIERHYLAALPNIEEPIITDTSKVVNTLNSLCMEMDARYDLLKDAAVRNIKEYNQKFIERRLNPEKGHRYMPYIVLVIDELADLMMTAGKEVETPIARLAQLARAIGIHLIIATQRPSVNVITGIIKANFPARLSFRVTSKVDSRTILDTGGAEQLVGMGDMLLSQGSDLTRLQCAFIDTPEVDDLCEFIGDQRGYQAPYALPEYSGDDDSGASGVDLADRDPMFDDAARLIVTHQQGSTSLIQRKLKLGYNRAGRLIDQLEAAGIVGPFEGSKAREVLVSDEYSLEQLLNSLNEK